MKKLLLLATGARIYEYLLPCPMLRGFLFNSIQKFRENNSPSKKNEILTKVIHRKSIIRLLDLNIFSNP